MDKKEEVLDVWNNAFRIVEIALGDFDMVKNISLSLKLITEYTKASDIQIFKFSNETNEMSNFANLKNNKGEKVSTFYTNGKLNNNIDELRIQVNNNCYIVLICNNKIKDIDFKTKYLKILERVFKIIFKKYELEEKVSKALTTDELTKTYNRYYYRQITKELFENGDMHLTFALVDLFSLKYINDNYGHIYGDYYIIKASKLLKDELDENDMLFRIGGDEFAIISKVNRQDDIIAKLERANDKLKQEKFGLDIPFPLLINYGVVDDVMDLTNFTSQADKILSYHKTNTYKNLRMDRRK